MFAATGEGGPPGVRVRYEMTSWVGTGRFASLRFHRKHDPGRQRRRRSATRSCPTRAGTGWKAAPRTGPPRGMRSTSSHSCTTCAPCRSQVGKSFTVSRYFQTGYNPIGVRVTGRQTVTLPDGQHVPASRWKLTSRGTTMGVRFTDDARRLPVEIDLPLPFGSVTLELTGVELSAQYRPR